jgi:hypothetical protein
VLVAMAVFAVALSGLVPLAVINSRQVRAMAQRVPAGETRYLVPPDEAWAAKLGAPAEISAYPPSPRTPVPDLLDDGDAGYSEIDLGIKDWYSGPDVKAYGNDYRKNNGSGIGDTAVWTFAGVTPCVYEVLVAYPTSASFAVNAPFRVFDDTTARGLKRIDQTVPPSGPVYNGVPWRSLGAFSIHSGILRVTLADDANGDVAADAVRIVPVKNDVSILSVSASPEAATLSVTLSVTVP